MATIILGGAPDGNWLPLLLPVVVILLIAISAEHVVKFIKRKTEH